MKKRVYSDKRQQAELLSDELSGTFPELLLIH